MWIVDILLACASVWIILSLPHLWQGLDESDRSVGSDPHTRIRLIAPRRRTE